ncbi:hypothetical protein L2E82_11925 [Cichorium intybus]|uniref:Uncharacterized protein n=1 Tax=Cichorium intybus TaxID=13427 RepID=A0ACB9GEK1_CICIN|nr:hypothetical protein L2E82_11925 [Cichorium intybus]
MVPPLQLIAITYTISRPSPISSTLYLPKISIFSKFSRLKKSFYLSALAPPRKFFEHRQFCPIQPTMIQHPEVNTNLEVNKNPPRNNPSTIPMNRGTTHIFYKTRMCQKFLEGNCKNGDTCTFAHGSKDLREPPPNWPDLVKDNRGQNWNDDQRIIHQMRICHKFVKTGECPYGEKCNFLHESPAKFKAETARTRESSVIKIQTMVDRGQPNGLLNNLNAIKVNTVSNDPNATFWKTRICSKWETTGQCVFGDKCHFAHGIAELNTPVARMEGDGSNAASSVHFPATELPPSDSAMAVPLPQGQGKGFAKLKLSHKKINRIYGDWIDDDEDEQDY